MYTYTFKMSYGLPMETMSALITVDYWFFYIMQNANEKKKGIIIHWEFLYSPYEVFPNFYFLSGMFKLNLN